MNKNILSYLDKALYDECFKDKPDEDKITELLSKGANINAVNKYGETILSSLMFSCNNPAFQDYLNPPSCDLKFIKFLLDIGADPNIITTEGYNCLFDACLTWNPTLVEMLLKAGADPNCVSDDGTNQSLLCWVMNDQYYEEHLNGWGGGVPLDEIVKLLKKYGAKHFDDIFTDKLEQYLNIDPFFVTGLATLRGNIKIENLKNADKELISYFKDWMSANPVECVSNFDFVPKVPETNFKFVINSYYKWGLILARRIKKLAGPSVRVVYHYAEPFRDDDEIKFGHMEIDSGFEKN